MEEVKFNGKGFGKSYEQYRKFVEAIKKKERPLIVGLNYVCMSREMYDQLSNSGGNALLGKADSQPVQTAGSEHDELVRAKCEINSLKGEVKNWQDSYNHLFDYYNGKDPYEMQKYLGNK